MSKRNSEYDFVWCPGCGDFGVRRALEFALTNYTAEHEKPYNTNVIVAGIGCSGNMVHLIEGDQPFGIHGIHGRTLPIALGVAKGLKEQHSSDKVWVFLGDMAFETGIFYEVHKYARNYNLPLHFIVEDNGVSTNTPTLATWGNVRREIPEDVIYYKYESKYPHYGTGKWVVF